MNRPGILVLTNVTLMLFAVTAFGADKNEADKEMPKPSSFSEASPGEGVDTSPKTTPATPSKRPRIVERSKLTVVIDIECILKRHARLQAMLEELRKEKAEYEQEVRGKQLAIDEDRENKEVYKIGTPEFVEIAERVARAQAKLNALAELKREEFRRREAKLYLTVYDQIQHEVSYFADRYGVNLVLNYNSEQPDPEDPDAAMQFIKSRVVYQKHLNITFEILKRIQSPSEPRTAETEPYPWDYDELFKRVKKLEQAIGDRGESPEVMER